MTGTERLAVQQLSLPRDALAGRAAVVTGAGRGIGREVARAFAWLGARIVIAEINESGLETERLIRESGGEAQYVQTDVAEAESVARLAATAHRAYGPVEISVNNAILCPTASVMEMPLELWDRTIAVNLAGTFLTCRTFLDDKLDKLAIYFREAPAEMKRFTKDEGAILDAERIAAARTGTIQRLQSALKNLFS